MKLVGTPVEREVKRVALEERKNIEEGGNVRHIMELADELLCEILVHLDSQSKEVLLGVNRKLRFLVLDDAKRAIFKRLRPKEVYLVFEKILGGKRATTSLPLFQSLPFFLPQSLPNIFSQLKGCYLELQKTLEVAKKEENYSEIMKSCEQEASSVGFLGYQLVKMVNEETGSLETLAANIESIFLLEVGRFAQAKKKSSSEPLWNELLSDSIFFYAAIGNYSRALAYTSKIDQNILKKLYIISIYEQIPLKTKTEEQLLQNAKELVNVYGGNSACKNPEFTSFDQENLYRHLKRVMVELVDRKKYDLAASITMLHPMHRKKSELFIAFCSLSRGNRELQDALKAQCKVLPELQKVGVESLFTQLDG